MCVYVHERVSMCVCACVCVWVCVCVRACPQCDRLHRSRWHHLQVFPSLLHLILIFPIFFPISRLLGASSPALTGVGAGLCPAVLLSISAPSSVTPQPPQAIVSYFPIILVQDADCFGCDCFRVTLLSVFCLFVLSTFMFIQEMIHHLYLLFESFSRCFFQCGLQ